MNTLENQNAIFPKGEKASADYFTGTAWVNILVPQDESGSYAIGNVVFEPGCRNNWHKHPAGQILLVTDGKGYYQEKGKPARLLAKGDVVVIPSHIEHWQAGPGKMVGVLGIGGLGHLAIKIAKAMGAHVVVFTTSPSKVKDAKRLGADEAVLSTDAVDSVRKLPKIPRKIAQPKLIIF